ncbi:nicotinate-nucleotide adenylyltransferase [Alteromonas sp. 5E99-2]|uniref:nicotinate-nucleotide adenylyltransferase n=1 Tax=Alteromonas sp. 5E99-2 TaxID=2817683 RepID=UPI001A98765F|nr:nicotinate-nucleotide adenylyltransferase [Alteromonas sp. 5E99-2]
MLGFYGGSFDPPHIGHSQCVVNAAKEINLNSVALLPCAQSPLKALTATPQQHRLAMLNLVCDDSNKKQKNVTLNLDETELNLPRPSFTVNTLKHLRKKYGTNSSLCFLLGEDSLYTLYKWKEWQTITNYCHLVVMRREGNYLRDNIEFNQWLNARLIDDVNTLHNTPNGHIYLCNSSLVTISSSAIRQMIAEQPESARNWLPESVAKYIFKHTLYTSE